jgi:hypothetical protein
MGVVEHTSYLAWNTRIALYWLARPSEVKHVYLTITPGSLSNAAWECDGVPFTPEDAEEDFIEAVRAMYRAYVVDEGNAITPLQAVHDGIPLSLAFLGLSVLAAYHMRDDGERRSTAYFPRLAELLGAPGEEPPNFSRPGFEELWQSASAWTERRLGTPLFLATGKLRKYEAYPIAHAALREVDLRRLADFFDWAQYAPGAAVALDTLKVDFLTWLSTGSNLTQRGLAACQGDRQEAALQQVVAELKTWSGFAPDAAGRRVAQVDIALDVPRGIPRLFYLARRPAGFPETFVHGEHQFDSLSEGWYEPLTIPRQHGELLFGGFQWISTQQTPNFVLRRAPAKAVALTPSGDSAGLVSRRRLLAGLDCAILFHNSIAEIVRERVVQLCQGRPCRWLRDPDLPEGWSVVDQVRVAVPRADTMPGLEALEVDAAVEVVTRGGLRIARRAEWLDEAPPQVFVSGIAPEHVTIDDAPARVHPDGRIEWRPRANVAGAHVVVAGRSYKRISLVSPRLASSLTRLLRRAPSETFPIGLARGAWTVLGRSAAMVMAVNPAEQQVVEVPFEPVWALRRTCALFLVDREVEPTQDGEVGQSWARSVLDAAESGVPVATIDPESAPQAIRSWGRFRALAARILQRQAPAGTRRPP